MASLDGLRAVAVAAVIVFHARVAIDGGPLVRAYQWVGTAGWVGVDLFFVLSGFLITGILLDAKDRPHYFRTFYVRRTLRIFPLYYAVLFGTLVIAPIFLGASQPGERTILREQAWLWTYTTNVEVLRWGGMLFTSGWISLTHLWSLAIEEQFYLVWPLLVRVTSRRALVVVAGAIVIAAPVVRVAMRSAGVSPAAVYEFTLCRLDPLAVGACCAVLVRARPAWAARASAILGGLGALGVAIAIAIAHRFELDAGPVQTLGLSALALGFGGAVLRAARGVRWLEARPLVAIGKYSYGMYLFHALLLPLYRRIYAPSSLAGALGFALFVFVATFAIAAASWHLFERRFLALKDRWAPSRTVGAVPSAQAA
jgi:peptidoglycan/LPS O-acetylase OafA/YrhL